MAKTDLEGNKVIMCDAKGRPIGVMHKGKNIESSLEEMEADPTATLNESAKIDMKILSPITVNSRDELLQLLKKLRAMTGKKIREPVPGGLPKGLLTELVQTSGDGDAVPPEVTWKNIDTVGDMLRCYIRKDLPAHDIMFEFIRALMNLAAPIAYGMEAVCHCQDCLQARGAVRNIMSKVMVMSDSGTNVEEMFKFFTEAADKKLAKKKGAKDE